MAFSGPDYQQRVNDIHGITALRELNSGHGGRRAKIPILDLRSELAVRRAATKRTCLNRLVPASSGQYSTLGSLYPAYYLDWGVMLSHLRGLACGYVEHPPSVVRPSRNDFRSILHISSKKTERPHR